MATRVTTGRLLSGLPEVARRLDEVAAAAGDLSPVWGELARLWTSRMDTVFDSNGLGRWAPRSLAAIESSQSPLVDQGVMRAGLTSRTPRYDDKQMLAFGPKKYDRRVMSPAVLHTVGTERMPKRVVVPPLRAAEKRAWIGLIERHMIKAVS
jgi:hypothetical protein